jgi:hypothetical protein
LAGWIPKLELLRAACALPGHRKPPIVSERNGDTKLSAFSIQDFLHPSDVLSRRPNKPEIPDLKRNEIKRAEISGSIDFRKVHEHQIVSIPLVSFDAFIIVQKITAPVENEPVAVNLYGLRMMRRMAVEDGDPGAIDQDMRQSSLVLWDFITPIQTPIQTPMDRNDNKVDVFTCFSFDLAAGWLLSAHG